MGFTMFFKGFKNKYSKQIQTDSFNWFLWGSGFSANRAVRLIFIPFNYGLKDV
jgi:hypothetical protein